MIVQEGVQEEIQVLKLSGIINAVQSQDLRASITNLSETGAKIVLVDCADVTFMDSSALGALVIAFKTLRAANTKLVLCSINENVRILFELTSMDTIFEIFPSQDEFKRSLGWKN